MDAQSNLLKNDRSPLFFFLRRIRPKIKDAVDLYKFKYLQTKKKRETSTWIRVRNECKRNAFNMSKVKHEIIISCVCSVAKAGGSFLLYLVSYA